MQLNVLPTDIRGFDDDAKEKFQNLTNVFNYHQLNNLQKEKYYDGKVTLGDVNLGIALPDGIRNLEVGCDWGSKAVDVLAARSMFDGFVSDDGNQNDIVKKIVTDNCLVAQYMRACKDELKFGATFATLSDDGKGGCQIRFHSPMNAAAIWSGEKGRIDYGLAIIDTKQNEGLEWEPTLINMYTDDAVYVIENDTIMWRATRYPHIMGRPLMEPLIWNQTTAKPFGRSRLKYAVRALIDSYVRTIANAAISLEFSTAPQKYLLGLTDEQFDAVVTNKFKQYIGSILAATTNPETGQNPSVGQFPQGSLAPHVEMIRIIATQFSAATGLTVTDVGVVNDANPTSSEAILAQSQTLVALAEQLNTSNGDALTTIIQMAQAIIGHKSLNALNEAEKGVIPHFKNPAMPSISAVADAALKIASTRQGFSSTDVFLEMVGFDPADIRRIKAQESRGRGQTILEELNANI